MLITTYTSAHPAESFYIASQSMRLLNRLSSTDSSSLSIIGATFSSSSLMSSSGTQIHPATMDRMQDVQDYPDVQTYNDTELDYFSSIYSSYASYNNSNIVSAHYKIMTALYIALPLLLATVGIVGNSTVIYIIIRHRDMQTVTNYFLANLAATDVVILTLCAIPFASSITAVLPTSVCKSINYIMFVS